jgi:hypothetical protein
MKSKKPVKPLKTRKKSLKGEVKSGALYVVAIMGVVVTFGGVMAGGVLPAVTKLTNQVAPGPAYACCDSGDGAACQPNTQKTITYNGATYGLLKSNIVQPFDEFQHLMPTGQLLADGTRIFVNNSDTFDAAKEHSSGPILPGSNCSLGKDYIALNDPAIPNEEPYYGGYFCIPNDELIYVCKDTSGNCSLNVKDQAVPFDVYYRLSDGPVPAEISTKCPKPTLTTSNSGQEIIGLPTPSGTANLQLETFQVKEEDKPNPWLSAWCKPAINLYPTEKTDVHVEVAPQGKMLLTIPQYPKNGWDVTAYPDGKITSDGKNYPYLYWEASIADKLISQPNDGYVVAYEDLGKTFDTLLPKLSLNTKEQKEFSDYWLKALPKSKYYFIGIVPQSQVNSIAPLNVSPAPQSVLRVSVYFKALDKRTDVQAPSLADFASFERKGFTVTEWGGFFKADKNHPNFTCNM